MLAGANALQQIRVGILECVSDTPKDRVDRAAADARAEQLLTQLHDIFRPLVPGA
jgi:hypothetical protein